MKPGVTVLPVASMTVAASAVTSPTCTMRSPCTPTSARRAGDPVPSTTAPPRITTSSTGPLLPRVTSGGGAVLQPYNSGLMDIRAWSCLHRGVGGAAELLGRVALLVGAGLDPVGPVLPPRPLM